MLETEGMSALKNDIRRMFDMFNDATDTPSAPIKTMLKNAAEPVKTEMQSILDSGTEKPDNRTFKLRSAISVGKVKKRASKGHKITIGVHRKDWSAEDDYYPAYVEYGHAGPRPAPPHPYIRLAYDRKKDEAYKSIRDELGNIIDGIMKK